MPERGNIITRHCEAAPEDVAGSGNQRHSRTANIIYVYMYLRGSKAARKSRSRVPPTHVDKTREPLNGVRFAFKRKIIKIDRE